MRIFQPMSFGGFDVLFGVFSRLIFWPLGLNPTQHFCFHKCIYVAVGLVVAVFRFLVEGNDRIMKYLVGYSSAYKRQLFFQFWGWQIWILVVNFCSCI